MGKGVGAKDPKKGIAPISTNGTSLYVFCMFVVMYGGNDC